MALKYVDQNSLIYIFTKIKENFVAKEAGKGLSANDFTNDLKTKLEGISAGAQVNVIEGVQVNGTDLTISGKKVNVTVPTKISDLGKVAESDLDAALAEKVNAASDGNHSHANKDLLDTYTQTEADLADAVSKKHTHANATELDLIATGDKAKWDAAAAKAHEHANASELALIATGDKAKWDAAATDTATIKADYLKAADKYDDTALKGRVAAIEADYLKAADKTELQGGITANAEAIAALQTNVGDKTVATQIDEALAWQEVE